MTDKFSTTVIINATPAKISAILTTPQIMSEWMGAENGNESRYRLEYQFPDFYSGISSHEI